MEFLVMSAYSSQTSRTDVVFQEIRLYIEGVQVPFISISITSTVGSLPTATIQIPPQSGLMDIIRYYQPKVHIFYIDPITGEECILFNGLLATVLYCSSYFHGE